MDYRNGTKEKIPQIDFTPFYVRDVIEHFAFKT